MFISRVYPNSLPTKFPARDVLEVLTQRPLREQGNVLYPKRVVESMTNRKMDAGMYVFKAQDCIKALCEKNEGLKKVYEESQKFFTRKTKHTDAIAWADKKIKEIGEFITVPQIGKPIIDSLE